MEVGVAGTRGAGSTDGGKPADSRRAGVPYAEEQGTLFDDDDGSEAGRGEASGTAERGLRGDDAGAGDSAGGAPGTATAGLDVDAVDTGYRGPTA